MKPLTASDIEAINAKHHRCDGHTCTCKCKRVFLENEEMLFGPHPFDCVWCQHYHDEIIPKPGTKTREWYQENDPQSLVDLIRGTQ